MVPVTFQVRASPSAGARWIGSLWVQEWDTENHPLRNKNIKHHIKLHISDKKSPFPPCFQKNITPHHIQIFRRKRKRDPFLEIWKKTLVDDYHSPIISKYLWMFVKMFASVVRAQAQDAMKKVISLGVYLGWETHVGTHKRYFESLLGWLVRCVWLVCCVCLVG